MESWLQYEPPGGTAYSNQKVETHPSATTMLPGLMGPRMSMMKGGCILIPSQTAVHSLAEQGHQLVLHAAAGTARLQVVSRHLGQPQRLVLIQM